MPKNSSASRDNKNEKKKKGREPKPLVKQVLTESVDLFLPRSSADSGFQEEDHRFIWETAAEEAAVDNSPSSFSRLSSSAEPKESSSERRRRRKDLLEKELEDDSDITLSEEQRREGSKIQETLSLSYSVSGQLCHGRFRQEQAKATPWKKPVLSLPPHRH
jgi:hypothetical protein